MLAIKMCSFRSHLWTENEEGFYLYPPATLFCRIGSFAPYDPRRARGKRPQPLRQNGNVPATVSHGPTPPPRGALSSGAVGPSPAHGRQQAGPGRVGLRSAGFRGRQATGFEAKGILKDHGSLSRSLVTFCRLRKSLALRRKYLFPPAIQFWYRGVHPL